MAIESKFTRNDIVSRIDLLEAGLEDRGKFADLHIFSNDKSGYLLRKINEQDYKVYFFYKTTRDRRYGK